MGRSVAIDSPFGLFFAFRQQFDDSRSRHGNMMTTLGQDIVIASHTYGHILELREARFQCENRGDLPIVEIPQDVADVGRGCGTRNTAHRLSGHDFAPERSYRTHAVEDLIEINRHTG